MRSFPAAGIVLWLVLPGLGLAACGGSGSGDSGGGPGEPPGPPAISFDPAEARFTSDRANPTSSSRVRVWLDNVTTSELFISGSFTRFATVRVDIELADTDRIPLIIHHRPAGTLHNGTYTDRVTFNACLDQACDRPVVGSPLAVTYTYTVTGTDPETGETGPPADSIAAPLEVQSRVALSHDVRDAEYSRSLDRVVMVATVPGNALYVYDPATGTEESVALAEEPTAVSISPDGLTAAVGHRGSISIVDLGQVGQPQPPEPLQLATTADAFDVALDGQGRAHVTTYGETDVTPVDLVTIDIATGVERRITTVGYGNVVARLEPIGGYLFIGRSDSGVVEKWDMTGDFGQLINYADTECSGSYGCGESWFNESGSRVYQQSGRVIGTDGPQNMNLPHVGDLALSGSESTLGDNLIVWLDHHTARNEIAVVDAAPVWCNVPDFGNPCYPRFSTFDSGLLTRLSIHSFAPMKIDGTPHIHRGLFVFYRSDGSSKVLLSRLDTMFDPERNHYLSVLE